MKKLDRMLLEMIDGTKYQHLLAFVSFDDEIERYTVNLSWLNLHSKRHKEESFNKPTLDNALSAIEKAAAIQADLNFNNLEINTVVFYGEEDLEDFPDATLEEKRDSPPPVKRAKIPKRKDMNPSIFEANY